MTRFRRFVTRMFSPAFTYTRVSYVEWNGKKVNVDDARWDELSKRLDAAFAAQSDAFEAIGEFMRSIKSDPPTEPR